jgi:hypothetical protein
MPFRAQSAQATILQAFGSFLVVLGCSTSSTGPTGDGPSSGGSSGNSGSAGTSASGNTSTGGSGVIVVDMGGSSNGGNGAEQAPPSALPEGGEVLGAGFSEASKTAIDAGTPAPASAPTVAYPLAGALFPANLAPVEVHLQRADATQTLVRISFHVEGFDLTLYDTCAVAEQDPNGCVVSIPAEVCQKLGDANYFGDLTTTVRISDSTGGNVGEAALEDVSWTYSTLTGGLYYWTTINGGPGNNTAIKRYDFSMANSAPEIYWSQMDSPQLTGAQAGAEQHACMGCHAISRDGTKIALSFGGSLPAAFSLIDVATKEPLAERLDTDVGFAVMSTFSPDNARIINSFHGSLLLREASADLTDVTELFADDTTEPKSHPFWSPTGDSVAFVTFDFTPTPQTAEPTGDIVDNSQIWLAPSDGDTVTGPATQLVPRATGKSSYYPAISDDGKFVVFNQSSCDAESTTGWGIGPCDGYNDVSARLMVIPADGGTPVDLARANGDQTWTNSWPRWSPDHGRFREQSVYWVAFSSRRPYGLRLAGGTTSVTKPQLWFAAVRATPGMPLELDPSFAPVWLPGQNENMATPTGNHIPQWVEKAVPIVVK